jgi:hypothetical protein
LPFGEPRRGLV